MNQAKQKQRVLHFEAGSAQGPRPASSGNGKDALEEDSRRLDKARGDVGLFDVSLLLLRLRLCHDSLVEDVTPDGDRFRAVDQCLQPVEREYWLRRTNAFVLLGGSSRKINRQDASPMASQTRQREAQQTERDRRRRRCCVGRGVGVSSAKVDEVDDED